jgi:DNA-binding GntR family transcriptional regulator
VTYRNAVAQLDLYRRATLTERLENVPLSTVEHRAILDAIEGRDADLTRRLMTEHVLQSRERMLEAVAMDGRDSRPPAR